MENSQKESEKKRFLENCLLFGKQISSGVISGFISKTSTAPLRRCKIIVQTQSLSPDTNFLSTFNYIYQNQGFLSFWRGNSASVLRSIPSSAVKFFSFDRYKKIMFPLGEKHYSGSSHVLRKLGCGALSGATTMVFSYPFDVVLTKLSVDIGKGSDRKYSGIVDCFKKVYKQNGVSGFYTGATVGAIGIIPHIGLSLASYDIFSNYFHTKFNGKNKNNNNKKKNNKDKAKQYLKNTSIKLLSGGLAGFVSQGFSYPFDTLRKRIQAQQTKKGNMEIIKQILKSNHHGSLYKGFFTSVALKVSEQAIQFFVWDSLVKLIKK